MRHIIRLVAIIFATVILANQPPLRGAAQEPDRPKLDSIKQVAISVRPKLDSVYLIDSVRLYTDQIDSISTSMKLNVKTLQKQQNKIVQQLAIIVKHNE